MPTVSHQKNEYEKDFYKWIKTQTKILKQRDFPRLDMENIIEEIESLGRSEKHSLKSFCVVLLMHLLKQKYQPYGDCKSWRCSITNARREIRFLCDDSPSLKKELEKIYPSAYETARKDASYETKLDIKKFPKECPWTLQEAMDFDG